MEMKYLTVIVVLSSLVWITETVVIDMTGFEQDGTKFIFTSTDLAPFGAKDPYCEPDYNFHGPTSTSFFFEAECKSLILAQKCVHVPDTNYITIYPDNNNLLLVGSCLTFYGGQFTGTFSVQTPLTSYNIWPFRINGLADPDRDISVFYIGDTNYIFPVLYNPDSLAVTYLWEQLEGDSIPLNATAETHTYAMGALGPDYVLQYGVKLRLTITIGGDIHVETRTIDVISQSVCVFSSTILTCTENLPYKLADPSCAGIISPDYNYMESPSNIYIYI